jgi:hypothetical protein
MRLAITAFFCAGIVVWIGMAIAGNALGTRVFKLGMDTIYTAASLRDMVKADTTRARRAVFPVLFPIDLLFLICLGTFLALSSLALAAPAHVPAGWRWGLVLAPAIYALSDLAENLLFARMLMDADAINKTLVDVTHVVTQVKLAFCALGGLQVLLLLILAAMP